MAAAKTRVDTRWVSLTGRYRLSVMDVRNWALQRLGDDGRWRDTGNYFQKLDGALSFVYEREMREGCPEGGEGLADALSRAQQLVEELKSSGGELA